MSKIMNSPKGVKPCVPERESISCPTCGTRHDLHTITFSQIFVQWVIKIQIYDSSQSNDYNMSHNKININ